MIKEKTDTSTYIKIRISIQWKSEMTSHRLNFATYITHTCKMSRIFKEPIRINKKKTSHSIEKWTNDISRKINSHEQMKGWNHWNENYDHKKILFQAQHHRLDGYKFAQTPGVGDKQGRLACCSPWGRKESDTTEWLNWSRQKWKKVWHSQGMTRLESYLTDCPGGKVNWYIHFGTVMSPPTSNSTPGRGEHLHRRPCLIFIAVFVGGRSHKK